MKLIGVITTTLLLVLIAPHVSGQESDYEVKRGFEESYNQIKSRIETTTSMASLDTMRAAIATLQTRYAPRRAFLDKALYPETFSEKMEALRSIHYTAVNRLRVTSEQTVLIAEYERTIALLTSRVDSLTREQKRLFGEVQGSKDLRETIRRLNQSIQLKDRLIFAMVDSIFMPYEKDLAQLSGAQREAVSRKVLKSNVVARVYDIAADNIKFLEVAKPQGKEFGALIDQARQFETKWSGLREKMNAVAVDVTQGAERQTGKTPRDAKAAEEQVPAAHVDSAIVEWRTRLMAAFWDGVAGEFSAKGIALQPFSDGQTFAASIRAYVESVKAEGSDAAPFVTVWKERIDKEWRDALSRENMPGSVEYATLDRLVSELGEKKLDSTFLAYIVVFLLIVAAIWWFVGRKPKPQKST